MKKKAIKNALTSSLKAEEDAVSKRFDKADTFLNKGKKKPFSSPSKLKIATKTKPEKVIRDAFTFPESDHKLIGDLKKNGLKLELQLNKSEIVRAGLHVLSELPKDKLKAVFADIEKIKTGRPSKK